MVLATYYGLTWDEACRLPAIMRRAYIYVIAETEGGKIDWGTGAVK